MEKEQMNTWSFHLAVSRDAEGGGEHVTLPSRLGCRK